MNSLAAIVVGGLLMSAIALVGDVTLLLGKETLDRILRPLLGGAFLPDENSRMIACRVE